MSHRALLVWAAATGIYVISVFNRSSLAVAGLYAIDRFHINALELSSLIVVQLFVYAVMQIPVGLLLDRFGSRILMLAGVGLLALGQTVFALTTDFGLAVAARAIVGMGDSFCFVSVLKLITIWFNSRRAPLITQVTSMLGNLGLIAATFPMLHLLAAFDWAKAFTIVTIVGLLAALALLPFISNSPPVESRPRLSQESQPALAAGPSVWREPGTRLGLWIHFTAMFSANTLGLIWGFPFLVSGIGLTATEASGMITVMTIAAIASGPVIGIVSGRYPAHRIALVLLPVCGMAVSLLAVLLYGYRPPLWLPATMMAFVGAGLPLSAVGFDIARETTPAERFGRASGIVNMGGFASSVTSIVLVGAALLATSDEGLSVAAAAASARRLPSAFTAAVSLQFALWTLGAAQIVRLRHRSRLAEGRARPSGGR